MDDLNILKLAVAPLDIYGIGYDELFSKIEKVSVVSTLMETPKRYVVVLEVVWKANPDLEIMDKLEFIRSATELGSEGSTHLYLVTGHHLPFYSDIVFEIFEKFNCFFEHPIVYTQKYVYISLVGRRKDLERFKDYLEEIHPDFRVISMKRYYVRGRSLLSILSPQQYRCLKLAVENGFYDIPKRVDTRKLAKATGLAHGTYSFHVRKAQRSIFKAIMS